MVSPDGEGFVYIRKRSECFRSWFEITKSTVDLKAGDDEVSINKPSPEVKLKLSLEEGEDYEIAVDGSNGNQTHVFIEHRNGKVEEVLI